MPSSKVILKEFQVSTNSVREELNQLTKTGLLNSEKNGRNVLYKANDQHPLFPELKSMVSKAMGIDQVIDSIVTRLGDLEKAYLIDDYAEGKDTGIVDSLIHFACNIVAFFQHRNAEIHIHPSGFFSQPFLKPLGVSI